MANTTVTAVKALIKTDKTDMEIMNIIAMADSYIKVMLGGSSPPSDILASWSTRLTAYYILVAANLNGITGDSTQNISSIKIGDAEIRKQTGNISTMSRGNSKSDWRSQVTEEIRTYIRQSRRGLR